MDVFYTIWHLLNHHLFFADLAIKDTGFGEIIPESDMVVFDEATFVVEIIVGIYLSQDGPVDLAGSVQTTKSTHQTTKSTHQTTKSITQ